MRSFFVSSAGSSFAWKKKTLEVSRNEQVFPKQVLQALNSKEDGTGHYNDVFIPVLSALLLEIP